MDLAKIIEVSSIGRISIRPGVAMNLLHTPRGCRKKRVISIAELMEIEKEASKPKKSCTGVDLKRYIYTHIPTKNPNRIRTNSVTEIKKDVEEMRNTGVFDGFYHPGEVEVFLDELVYRYGINPYNYLTDFELRYLRSAKLS